MHSYSWVVTDVHTQNAIPTAAEMTAACLSMEAILDDPEQERIGWYVIGGRWTQRLAPDLADCTPLPHDMQMTTAKKLIMSGGKTFPAT